MRFGRHGSCGITASETAWELFTECLILPSVERTRKAAMTYYADLTPCEYFPMIKTAHPLLAVGWLEATHPFTTGSVEPGVRRRLAMFVRAARAWEPIHCSGGQNCGLCGEDGNMSIWNVFVPGVNVTYVAPEGILHYVQAHQYRPPDEFCAALVMSPRPTTAAYFRQLRSVGWSQEQAQMHEWRKRAMAMRRRRVAASRKGVRRG
jgi:hypothetical protein